MVDRRGTSGRRLARGTRAGLRTRAPGSQRRHNGVGEPITSAMTRGVFEAAATTAERQGRRTKRRGITPWQQGDLDGLCGVYTIINAVHYLCAGCGSAYAADLFRVLIKALRRRDAAHAATVVHRGIDGRTLRRLLTVATQYASLHLGVALEISKLPKRRTHWSLASLWHALDQELAAGRVAILGLGGRHHHWTLAVSITARRLVVFDSDKLRHIRRRSCTVGQARTRISVRPELVIVIGLSGDADKTAPSRRRVACTVLPPVADA
jgi:hypothetical protein